MLTSSAAELSTLLETVETTLNGLPDSLTDVPVVVSLPFYLSVHSVGPRGLNLVVVGVGVNIVD